MIHWLLGALMGAGGLLQDASLSAESSALVGLEVSIKAKHARVPLTSWYVAEVEVTNSGPLNAEPLEFKFDWVGAHGIPGSLILPRVNPPYHGRVGRAVPPGGKRLYPLMMHHVSFPPNGGQLSVSLASFFGGELRGHAPISLGESVGVSLDPNNFLRPTLRVRNESFETVDAIIQARMHGEERGPVLLRLRVPPNGDDAIPIDWVNLVPGCDDGLKGPWFDEATLVDWSVLGQDDGSARVELTGALNRLASWPSETSGWQARYEVACTLDPYSENERQIRASGEFILDRGSVVPKFISEESDPTVAAPLARLSEHMILVFGSMQDRFVDIRDQATEVLLHRKDQNGMVVFVRPPKSRNGVLYRLEGGRIVHSDHGPNSIRQKQRFGYEAWQGGGLLNHIGNVHEPMGHLGGDLDVQYENVAGHWFPVRMRLAARKDIGEGHSRTDSVETYLTLTDVRLTEAGKKTRDDPRKESEGKQVRRPAPAGELAELVKAAWDMPYRYPETELVVSANLDLLNPGGDPTLGKKKRTKKSISIRGFSSSSWNQIDFKRSNDHDSKSRSLSWVLEKRVRFALRTNFSAQPDFATLFAGASVSLDGNRIRIENGPFQSMRIIKGKVHSVTWNDGTECEFGWQEHEGSWVCNRMLVGDQLFETKHKWIGGRLIPIQWVTEGLLRDSIRETMTLTGIQAIAQD